MWWTEDRLTLRKPSSGRSLKVSKLTKLGNASRKAEAVISRSESARKNRNPAVLDNPNLDTFRSLPLSSDQRTANLELGTAPADIESALSPELKQLEADIRALEKVVREGQSKRQRQEWEIMRLRSECSRWLSETQMLSKQLSADVESRYEATGQFEIVHAELQARRVLPDGQGSLSEKVIFTFPNTQSASLKTPSASQNSRSKAA